MKIVSSLMPSLLQAGCLGENRALHLASVLYSSGLGVKKQPYKVGSCVVKIQNLKKLARVIFSVFVCGVLRPGCCQYWELRRTGGWLSSGWGTCTMLVIRAWQQTLTYPTPIILTSPGKPQLIVSKHLNNRYLTSNTRAINSFYHI